MKLRLVETSLWLLHSGRRRRTQKGGWSSFSAASSPAWRVLAAVPRHLQVFALTAEAAMNPPTGRGKSAVVPRCEAEADSMVRARSAGGEHSKVRAHLCRQHLGDGECLPP